MTWFLFWIFSSLLLLSHFSASSCSSFAEITIDIKILHKLCIHVYAVHIIWEMGMGCIKYKENEKNEKNRNEGEIERGKVNEWKKRHYENALNHHFSSPTRNSNITSYMHCVAIALWTAFVVHPSRLHCCHCSLPPRRQRLSLLRLAWLLFSCSALDPLKLWLGWNPPPTAAAAQQLCKQNECTEQRQGSVSHRKVSHLIIIQMHDACECV